MKPKSGKTTILLDQREKLMLSAISKASRRSAGKEIAQLVEDEYKRKFGGSQVEGSVLGGADETEVNLKVKQPKQKNSKQEAKSMLADAQQFAAQQHSKPKHGRRSGTHRKT